LFCKRRGWSIALSTILLIAVLIFVDGMIYEIKSIEYEIGNFDEYILKYSASLYIVNKFINSNSLVIFYPDSIEVVDIGFNETYCSLLVRKVSGPSNLDIYYKIIIEHL